MIDLRSSTRRALAGVMLVCLVAVPLRAAEKPYGGATPEELVARMRAAAESGDLGEMMACMAPEDRKAIGGTMVMMGVMMVGFSQMAVDMGADMAQGMGEAMTGEELSAEQKAEMEAGKAETKAKADEMTAKLRAVLEPQGLGMMLDQEGEMGSGDSAAMEAALENADMIALTESMMALLKELGDDEEEAGMEGEGMSPADEAKPDWSDREVTDYQVDGDHATAMAGDEKLEMMRVDGRWYFAPQMQMDGMGMDDTGMGDMEMDDTDMSSDEEPPGG